MFLRPIDGDSARILWPSAGVKGLQAARGVEDNAEVTCEGGSERCWSRLRVDL